MKQISILSGKAHVIELPEGATNPQLLTVHQGSKSFPSLKYDRPDLVRGFIDLPPGNWRIIGMLSEVTEGQAAELVEKGADNWGDEFGYHDYLGMFHNVRTALESLESSILAEGYSFAPSMSEIYDSESECMRIVESRVLDRSRCLLLGRVDG